ncbi:MAG: zinc ribbon domain-containing protein [Planctomycetota bacterium]|nr:zinc ribbon domain-containing protein [Planctomycetota bacterium]MDA1106142.1 zinc ribbon domain-containing protein [Planctomycetota bacterium]
MPIYEYECKEDGTVIELLRPMRDADKPVEDPDGKDRTFGRRHSVFGVNGTQSGPAGGGHVHTGGCCPCGKTTGQCGSN